MAFDCIYFASFSEPVADFVETRRIGIVLNGDNEPDDDTGSRSRIQKDGVRSNMPRLYLYQLHSDFSLEQCIQSSAVLF